ncbi:MAG TPA: branched-chain amino acid ABC transporter permease [Solirubrobacteraceae bacterium]|nr:branched-chain amino acid ABC transporter permease [Solirubrobacteraceae bacterium]
MSFYITTLLIYAGIDIMACWGLNLQFGFTGINNFAFIVFQAAGAYTAAVLSLGPQSGNGGFQHYLFGASLPFPLPILMGGVVAGVLSLLVGLITLRRLRTDYQAMVMLVIAVIATLVVENLGTFLNGAAGLALIPQPLSNRFSSLIDYQWAFVAFTVASCLVIYFFVHRITSSPLGRALRSVRDHEFAAAALGKDVARLRMFSFVTGGVIAGISGGILVSFITAWSPGSWLYVETLVLLTAVIVGGTGNNFGVMLGAMLVPVAFNEATRYLPQFGRPGLIDAVQWIIIGLLALVFLWFRPQGIVPERRRRYRPPVDAPGQVPAAQAVPEPR